MNTGKLLSLAAAALMACCHIASAQIELPKVIGNDMVLQQGKDVAIWGKGVPGKTITVRFAGQTVRTAVEEDGGWMLRLSPMEASSEARRMTISDGKTTIRLDGVLVGEVWLASGQSNMEYRMDRPLSRGDEPGTEVQTQLLEQGGDSRVNVLYVEKKTGVDTLPSDGWKTSSKETVAPISAPAYFFARTLADSLGVPVGIISSSWGGSQIETWMPREIIDDYADAHPGSRVNGIPESAWGTKFASMIAPICPYTIRGFIWYQGESNLLDNPESFGSYYDKQKLLVESWRSFWGDGDLPFYYVQLAPYDYSKRKDAHPVSRDMLPQFWEIQRRLMEVPGTGMAQTTDLADKTGDIHPPYKHIVGYRLALWALKNEYGRSGLETLGPELESAMAEDGRLVLEFNRADGLKTDDGGPVNCFRILYSNLKLRDAVPEISGDRLIFEIPDGLEVLEVRFAWDEASLSNLVNGFGLPALPFRYSLAEASAAGDDRGQWVAMLDKIARPVISNLAAGTLKQNMPFESRSDSPRRLEASRLEALGRTVCGLGPWLSLGPDDTPEGALRAEYIAMLPKAIGNAVNPESPDYLTFGRGNDQSLVDAAFLAEGILRGGEWIWPQLDPRTQQNLITEWKRSRSVIPKESNWLLFASMVEAALLEYTGECDTWRLRYGVHRFIDDGWYKGDGVFGDGMEVHVDYYNSLVIHPMLTDVMTIMVKHGMMPQERLDRQLLREQLLAAQLEMLISPEGTYPVIGRSITYRTGHLHALAHTVLLGNLPERVSPGQARAAMTAVMKRQFASPDNFAGGWLTVGFAGHQLNMSEEYINTGSEYMCTAFFLPLGLPEDNAFWAEPAADWTSRKAWHGVDVGADHALRDSKL